MSNSQQTAFVLSAHAAPSGECYTVKPPSDLSIMSTSPYYFVLNFYSWSAAHASQECMTCHYSACNHSLPSGFYKHDYCLLFASTTGFGTLLI